MENQDHDGVTLCVGCQELECECRERETAWRALVSWIVTPGTSRRVTNIARSKTPTNEAPRGPWIVALSAGGFVVESATQRTLAGAIRNALQAALLIVLCLVLGFTTGACGGQAEGSTGPSEPARDVCTYSVDGCRYTTPILGEGTRELSCPLALDYTQVIDVVCGDAALPACVRAGNCE